MKIISVNNLQSAKNQIKQTTERPIIIHAQDTEFNRKVLEYGKIDVLLSIEKTLGKDRLKQLDSGFNHVLARIAAKNNIAIGLDIKEISEIKDKRQKALRLARIRENIKTARKAKTKLALLNYKDKKNALEFLISLGAPTSQAKQALLY